MMHHGQQPVLDLIMTKILAGNIRKYMNYLTKNLMRSLKAIVEKMEWE